MRSVAPPVPPLSGPVRVTQEVYQVTDGPALPGPLEPVGEVRPAGRASGHHGARACLLDGGHLPRADGLGYVVVVEAEAPGPAAAGRGVLHLDESHAGKSLDEPPHLVVDSLAPDEMAGVVDGHDAGGRWRGR